MRLWKRIGIGSVLGVGLVGGVLFACDVKVQVEQTTAQAAGPEAWSPTQPDPVPTVY